MSMNVRAVPVFPAFNDIGPKLVLHEGSLR